MLIRHNQGFTAGSGDSTLTNWTNWWQLQHDAGIPVNAIMVDNAGPIFEIQQSRFVSPDGDTDTLIWRRCLPYADFDPNTPNYKAKPEEEATRVLSFKYNFLWPPELDEFRVWLKDTNEIRTRVSSPEDAFYQNMTPSEWWGRYGLAGAKWTVDRNLRVIFFSPSSGDHDEAFWSHPKMLEFLSFAAENRDHIMVGLHEYSYVWHNLFAIEGNDNATVQDVVGADGDTIWKRKIGRFKILFDTCDKHGVDWPDIYFPEWGWAQERIPNTPEQAMEQIIGAVQNVYGGYRKYIKGYGMWYLTEWQGEPIDKQVNKLLLPCAELAINNVFLVDEKKPRGGNMPDKHKVVIVKIPQEVDESFWKYSAEWSYNNYKRTQTASTDDMLTMLRAGNEESYAVVLESFYPSQREAIQRLTQEGFSYIVQDSIQPPADYIDVIIYNQCDSRWANKILGNGTKTICQWGCLLTAYTMLADFWGINSQRTPDLENNYYKTKGVFSGSDLVSMAMSKVYPSVKNEGWLPHTDSRMHPKTKDYLSRGIPVPARVDFNPQTGQWEQHWVLLVGWDEERQDYLMNNPWGGDKAVYVNDYYYNQGVLECIYYYLDAEQTQTVDVTPYFLPTGTAGVYTVFHFNDGRTQPQQMVRVGDKVIVYKGEGQWFPPDTRKYQDYEQWQVTPEGIRRYVDTSDAGNGGKDAYTLNGAVWIPKNVVVGTVYNSTPRVTRFNRTNCQLISDTTTTDYLYVKEIIPTWTSPKNSTIRFNDVLVIEWRKTPDINTQPIETYKFAKNVGYVEWNTAAVGELPQRNPMSGELTTCSNFAP